MLTAVETMYVLPVGSKDFGAISTQDIGSLKGMEIQSILLTTIYTHNAEAVIRSMKEQGRTITHTCSIDTASKGWKK